MLSFLLSLFALFSNPIFATESIVHKYVLDNGFTVLIHPIKTTQNVSTQLWINVGSKHESDDEKGLAHWLEHMCFKGTEKMSETDISLVCTKLSGSYNADTNYDTTRFYIDLPLQHWQEALPILSDMMSNCTFKQDLLNAELQVVIQEMKDAKDNLGKQVFEQLMAAVFPDHPYHYPVIGYKSDLVALTRDKLVAFYKKHYIPNNATLVIVGNIDPQHALDQVKLYFASKEPNFFHTSQQCRAQETICSKSIKLYRNIQNPVINVVYTVPGITDDHTGSSAGLLSMLLTRGQNSRLYKKLVEGAKLVNSIGANVHPLYDHSMLWISFEPFRLEDTDFIIKTIQAEIDAIAKEGPTQEEIERTCRSYEMENIKLYENNHIAASTIGSLYLATANENLLFEESPNDTQIISDLKILCKQHLRSIKRHEAHLLPLSESDTDIWQNMQTKSNQEDAYFLKTKPRQSDIEQGKYVHTIQIKDPAIIEIPKPETISLSNGLKVLYYHNGGVPHIEMRLQLKFDKRYEPKDKAPLCDIYTAMMLEGTKNYSKEKLFTEFEKRGISLNVGGDFFTMNMLKKEAKGAFELLTDILCNPLLEQEKLDKHKQLALTWHSHIWDDPSSIMCYLMGKHLYQEAGFFKEPVGTPESIERITLQDITAFHAAYCSPHEAIVVIVGNIENLNLIDMLENTLGKWKGPAVEDAPLFNQPVAKSEIDITYHIDREQVLLGCIGLSVNRKHEDYKKLILFDIVFNNKLFNLRQKTNAMYWINGSVIDAAGNTSPAEIFIKTQVSQTRVQEVRTLISDSLESLADSFNEEDLVHALQAIVNSTQNAYSTIGSTADTFLFLENKKLPYDYMVACLDDYKKITVQEVRDAVKKVLNKDNLTFFMVGPTV